MGKAALKSLIGILAVISVSGLPAIHQHASTIFSVPGAILPGIGTDASPVVPEKIERPPSTPAIILNPIRPSIGAGTPLIIPEKPSEVSKQNHAMRPAPYGRQHNHEVVHARVELPVQTVMVSPNTAKGTPKPARKKPPPGHIPGQRTGCRSASTVGLSRNKPAKKRPGKHRRLIPIITKTYESYKPERTPTPDVHPAETTSWIASTSRSATSTSSLTTPKTRLYQFGTNSANSTTSTGSFVTSRTRPYKYKTDPATESLTTSSSQAPRKSHSTSKTRANLYGTVTSSTDTRTTETDSAVSIKGTTTLQVGLPTGRGRAGGIYDEDDDEEDGYDEDSYDEDGYADEEEEEGEEEEDEE